MTTAETVTLTWSPDPRKDPPTAAHAGAAGDRGPQPQLVIPSRLGSVRLIRELGHGGMGVVWLGHHEFLDRQVAVKFLLATVADRDDPKFQMFLDGARAAAQVRHLGLTAVLHADMVEHVPYLVMEYVSGPTLAELVERTGPLRPAAVLAVLERVADALDELHEAGVVHRDVKPSNILVDIQGQAYLTDFGLACRLENRERIATSGTPTYMAPESFEGEVSPRTDIYSLAATVYHLLSGRAPFAGSAAELRELHSTHKFPAEPLRAVSVPEPVIEALDRAANIDPRFRTKSARKLLETFREAIGKANAPAVGVDQLARLVAALMERGSDIAAADSGSGGAGSERQGSGSPVAESQVLAEPVPCVACGYELRGLPIAARCPECQHPIERSLDPGRLIFADPAWLARVNTGFWLVCAGAAMLFIVGIVAALVHALSALTPVVPLWGAVAAWLSAPPIMLGYFLAASRERNPAVRAAYWPMKAWFVGLLGLATLAAAALYGFHAKRTPNMTNESLLGSVLWVLLASLVGAVPAYLCFMFAVFLKRSPRTKLRAMDAGCRWLSLVGVFSMLQVSVVFARELRPDYRGLLAPGDGFRMLVGVGAPCAAIASAYFSWRLRNIRRTLIAPGAWVRAQRGAGSGGKSSTYYQSLSSLAGRRRGGPTTPPPGDAAPGGQKSSL